LTNLGWKKACANDKSLEKELNIIKGKIIYKEISEAFELEAFNA
jgi:alanine dehydrogenase